jgi:hypothetical protein
MSSAHGLGTREDRVGPEPGHRHRLLALRDQPVVDRVERRRAGQQQRISVGEADPVAGERMRLDGPPGGVGLPGQPGVAAEELAAPPALRDPHGHGLLRAEDPDEFLRPVGGFVDVQRRHAGRRQQQAAGAAPRGQPGEPGRLPLGDPDAVGVDHHPPPIAGQAPGLHGDGVVVEPVTTLERVRVQARDAHAVSLSRPPFRQPADRLQGVHGR